MAKNNVRSAEVEVVGRLEDCCSSNGTFAWRDAAAIIRADRAQMVERVAAWVERDFSPNRVGQHWAAAIRAKFVGK